ncbi:MAG: triose-phosphate isomerase [Polyangia bacterium]
MSQNRIPRPLFCGNWKLWGSLSESVALATGVRDATAAVTTVDVAVGPGFVALATVADKLKSSPVGVAAQDGYWEVKGAFTGEVAMAQIADAGARYVIIGHSERRQLFSETDANVGRKAKAALALHLTPIVCIGETLAERDAGQALTRVSSQLDGATRELSDDELAKVVIAYEPVWAIGTGRNATPDQAQAVHAAIRAQLTSRLRVKAQEIRILYGGSVKPDNVASLMGQKDIDGALVGGASLTVESFAKLVKEGASACIRS